MSASATQGGHNWTLKVKMFYQT